MALIVAVALTSFVGCQKKAEEAPAATQAAAPAAPAKPAETPAPAAPAAPAVGPYEDGSYMAMGPEFSHGWKTVVSLTVEGGNLTDAIFSGVAPSAAADKIAFSKAGLYGMNWDEQAEKAAAYLLKTQDPSAVTYTDEEGHTDDIAGVSVHVSEFFQLAQEALDNGPVMNLGYADGSYIAFGDEFSATSGWKEYVALTVVGGRIASVNWSAINRDGADKKAYDAAGKYGMSGENGTWTEQAVRSEDYLIKVQDPAAVSYSDAEGHSDDIAGVSIHVGGMFELAAKALAAGPKAIGPYADGGYWALADEGGNGWTEYVTLFVHNGNIADVYWSALSDEGEDKVEYDKAGNYGMVAFGGAQADWNVQAAKAEDYLIATQDPAAVNYIDEDGHTDDIAGVSIHVNGLFDIAAAALAAGPIEQ